MACALGEGWGEGDWEGCSRKLDLRVPRPCGRDEGQPSVWWGRGKPDVTEDVSGEPKARLGLTLGTQNQLPFSVFLFFKLRYG